MKILIVGGDSFIGCHLKKQLNTHSSFEVFTTTRREGSANDPHALYVDLEKDFDWASLQAKNQFDGVYWVGQIKDVKWCEKHKDKAIQVNVYAAEKAIKGLEKANKLPQFIFLSSDYVFDGRRGLYQASDEVSPTSLYGQWKVQVEKLLAQSMLTTRSIRTSAVVGPKGVFFEWVISSLKKTEKVDCFSNSFFTPTSVTYLCRVLVDLMLDQSLTDRHCLLHVCGDQRYSRFEFVKKISDFWTLSKATVTGSVHPGYEKFDLSLVSNYAGSSRKHSWDDIMFEVENV